MRVLLRLRKAQAQTCIRIWFDDSRFYRPACSFSSVSLPEMYINKRFRVAAYAVDSVVGVMDVGRV